MKNRQAGAAVSAGNTGALMAMAKFCLRPLPGIERPAIAAIWPTLRGESIVLDVGATIGADAKMLVDFAMMGAAMARSVFGLDRPTVGAAERRRRGDQGRRAGARSGTDPARDEPSRLRVSRLRRGRRPRQGHRRRRRHRRLCRQHCAEDRRGHGAADRRISPLGDGRAPGPRGSAICSLTPPSGCCGRRWIRAR